MAILETDWQRFLSPDSEIPPDVFFLVKSEHSENGEDRGESIRAHRIFLAGVSPVFRRMFYGPMKETGDVIPVRGTTHEAFATMINYVYRPPAMGAFDLAAVPKGCLNFWILLRGMKWGV